MGLKKAYEEALSKGSGGSKDSKKAIVAKIVAALGLTKGAPKKMAWNKILKK